MTAARYYFTITALRDYLGSRRFPVSLPVPRESGGAYKAREGGARVRETIDDSGGRGGTDNEVMDRTALADFLRRHREALPGVPVPLWGNCLLMLV